MQSSLCHQASMALTQEAHRHQVRLGMWCLHGSLLAHCGYGSNAELAGKLTRLMLHYIVLSLQVQEL